MAKGLRSVGPPSSPDKTGYQLTTECPFHHPSVPAFVLFSNPPAHALASSRPSSVDNPSLHINLYEQINAENGKTIDLMLKGMHSHNSLIICTTERTKCWFVEPNFFDTVCDSSNTKLKVYLIFCDK